MNFFDHLSVCQVIFLSTREVVKWSPCDIVCTKSYNCVHHYNVTCKSRYQNVLHCWIGNSRLIRYQFFQIVYFYAWLVLQIQCIRPFWSEPFNEIYSFQLACSKNRESYCNTPGVSVKMLIKKILVQVMQRLKIFTYLRLNFF